MIIRVETKFDIGDLVYHVTPDSDKGIILDIQYFACSKITRYYVAFGRLPESYG
jgi:hypothetical protein